MFDRAMVSVSMLKVRPLVHYPRSTDPEHQVLVSGQVHSTNHMFTETRDRELKLLTPCKRIRSRKPATANK